jgi:type IV pilus biogenesis protein CpaD/CtpE
MPQTERPLSLNTSTSAHLAKDIRHELASTGIVLKTILETITEEADDRNTARQLCQALIIKMTRLQSALNDASTLTNAKDPGPHS